MPKPRAVGNVGVSPRRSPRKVIHGANQSPVPEQDKMLKRGLKKRARLEEEGLPVHNSADDNTEAEPFCAPAPNRYRCRFRSVCDDCFAASKPCGHLPEKPLRVLIVGHNPSTDVWGHGYCYGNPTNRMWKLLTGTLADGFDGLIPKDYDPFQQNTLPSEHGIGIASVATIPGNDANKFSKVMMKSWIPNFYGRLRSHVKRVQKAERHEKYRSPSIIAFEGKRHFALLYETEPTGIPFGPLPDTIELPPAWPFSRLDCQIWILPSSSGRAAMTHAERIGPYAALASFVAES